jgi:hypothetical protein
MKRRQRPAIVFATRSGGTTLDRDAFGGNPFATALIELSAADGVSLRQFPRRLRALTVKGSQGHQTPEWSSWPARGSWRFALPPGARNEQRCALVLIVSDYSRPGLPALGGAAHDERRISAMFAANGFSVVQGVGSTRAAILRALSAFRRTARSHDVAVIYSTGHGIECDGKVYLVPGDYPFPKGYSPQRLRARAVPVDRIARAGRAARLNLVFFAGCRSLASTAGSTNRSPITGQG